MKTITIRVPFNDLVREGGALIIQLLLTDENPKTIPLPTFFEYMETQEKLMKDAGKVRSTETCRVALSRLRQFRNGQDFQISELSQQMMADFESWLLRSGVVANTTSFYMRVLRRFYNRALHEFSLPDYRPFASVYTGIAKTEKRAIGLDDLRRLMALDLTDADQRFARDMFMFSLYTRGMSFIDMAFLRKDNLKNGVLSYHRHKTGQLLHIRWEPPMQQIVDRYPQVKSDYLLPIIRCENKKERSQFRHRQRRVNEDLHSLSARLGLQHRLTMYVARHSWASIAQSLSVPLSVISRGMGHDSEKTTQIYLKDLDNGRIDEANRVVLTSLLG